MTCFTRNEWLFFLAVANSLQNVHGILQDNSWTMSPSVCVGGGGVSGVTFFIVWDYMVTQLDHSEWTCEGDHMAGVKSVPRARCISFRHNLSFLNVIKHIFCLVVKQMWCPVWVRSEVMKEFASCSVRETVLWKTTRTSSAFCNHKL